MAGLHDMRPMASRSIVTQRDARAAAGADAGRLRAGVAAADHDHVEHVSRGTAARETRSLPDAELREDLGEDVAPA